MNFSVVWRGSFVLIFTGLLGSCAKEKPTEPKGVAAELLITVQPQSTIAAGAPIAMLVTVVDENGAPAVNATMSVTVSLASGAPAGAVLGGTLTRAVANGVVLFDNLTIDRAGGYALMATAPTTTLASAKSDNFTVTGGLSVAATKLIFLNSPPTSATSLSAMSAIQVAVADAGGNVVTGSGASVTIALTSGAGTAGAVLGGTLTQVAVSGIATFSDLTVDKVGTGYTLTPVSSGLTTAPSNHFAVTAGSPTKLAFVTQPANSVAGTSFSPAVRVAIQDVSGNTTNNTNDITLSITAGTGAQGATLTGANGAAQFGVATFGGSINKSGSGYTLTANAVGLTSATSTAFDVAPGAAAKLTFLVQPSSAAIGAAISPGVQVVVQDANGNTITSATNSITLTITNGTGAAGAVLGGTVAKAAIGGNATFSNLTIDKAGTGYTLSAAATALTGATSTIFGIAAAGATKLALTTNAAGAPSASAFTTQPVVTIQDAGGSTVTSDNSSIVTMTVSGSGVVIGTATATAAAGVATFTNVGISGKADTTYTLTFSRSGLTSATQNIVDTGHGKQTHVQCPAKQRRRRFSYLAGGQGRGARRQRQHGYQCNE